jgi:hypothetical protein
MDDQFDVNEMLLRAVYPPNIRPDMWHGKRITSAAFKDKRGLSVDRLYNRQVDEGVRFMRTKLHGHIVSVTVNDCNNVSAHVVYCPSPNNIFHSEIHGSPDTILLNEDQCLALSRRAVVVSYEEMSIISK